MRKTIAALAVSLLVTMLLMAGTATVAFAGHQDGFAKGKTHASGQGKLGIDKGDDASSGADAAPPLNSGRGSHP